MALRGTKSGTTKPRGFYLPELPRPECVMVQAFQRTLGARNGEVVDVPVRLGPEQWQRVDGRQGIGELLATLRTQAPCDANLPPIRP